MCWFFLVQSVKVAVSSLSFPLPLFLSLSRGETWDCIQLDCRVALQTVTFSIFVCCPGFTQRNECCWDNGQTWTAQPSQPHMVHSVHVCHQWWWPIRGTGLAVYFSKEQVQQLVMLAAVILSVNVSGVSDDSSIAGWKWHLNSVLWRLQECLYPLFCEGWSVEWGAWGLEYHDHQSGPPL